MDSEQRRVKKLFLAFKRSIIHGDIPTEFDEGDLIDIYDYATDTNDEYAQIMVLLSAARMYPDSAEIAQRRGYYFYEHLPLSEGAEALAKAHSNETPLWAILKELLTSSDERNPRQTMDYILENFSDYDDETIIQMIDACVDLGIIDWIKEYKAEIQKKCLYPETFLYELAQEADASGDTKYASKILEELTNLVPFNSGYWFMLSQYYLMLGEYDNALNAIDYALAIDPKSVEMRLRRIHILYLINDDRSQAEHLLLNLISEYPDNLDVMTSYVSLLVMGGHREMAAEVLLRYIKQQPGNRDLINSMINLELKDFSEKALDIYYDQGSKDPNEWMTWASSYYDADQPRQCADILLAFLRNDCNGIANYALLFETLYTSSEHQEICRIYDELNASGAIEHTSLTPIEFLYIALSMMYLGRTAEARDLSAKQLIELKTPSCGNAKERMVDNTLRDTFEKIIYVVDENQDINICDIDPFT